MRFLEAAVGSVIVALVIRDGWVRPEVGQVRSGPLPTAETSIMGYFRDGLTSGQSIGQRGRSPEGLNRTHTCRSASLL